MRLHNLYCRSAYIKLSKELHPDHNAGKSPEENEYIHNEVGH